jgi:hypothetical protein
MLNVRYSWESHPCLRECEALYSEPNVPTLESLKPGEAVTSNPSVGRPAGTAAHLKAVRRSRNGYALSLLTILAFVVIFAAGLSQTVALSRSPPPPTESSLSRNPALVGDWANRLLANDPFHSLC